MIHLNESPLSAELGTRIGFEEHLGYRCEVRQINDTKVCSYVRQPGVPDVLVNVNAWSRNDGDDGRYFRLGHVNPVDTINVAYFEPPVNVRYVVNETGALR